MSNYLYIVVEIFTLHILNDRIYLLKNFDIVNYGGKTYEKNKISVLLMIILLLSGVTTNVYAGSTKLGQEGALSQNIEKTLYSSNVTDFDDTNTSIPKFTIKFANGPKPMTLEEHAYISANSGDYKAKPQLPTIGPLYQKTWRLQPVSIKIGSTPEATFELGNTGSEPITITDDNIHFMYLNAVGDNMAGSKIVGGAVTVQPNSIATIKLTAINPNTRVIYVKIGQESQLCFLTTESDTEIINDTNPLSVRTGRDITAATSFKVGSTVGNGKFKFQILGSKIIENEQIGKLSKPVNGALILVKVRIANTSNETMNISSLTLKSDNWNILSNEYWEPTNVKTTTWSSNDQSILGEYGLPTEIKPNTIVEGFIPAIMYDVNENISVIFNTNLGQFNVKGIETLNLWAW